MKKITIFLIIITIFLFVPIIILRMWLYYCNKTQNHYFCECTNFPYIESTTKINCTPSFNIGKKPEDNSGSLKILPPITLAPTEFITINSEDNPELGLAGYSSVSLPSSNQLVLLAPDRKKVFISSFPCESDSTQITAVRGHFKILFLENIEGPVLDRYELGQIDFITSPPEIEQYSAFHSINVGKYGKHTIYTLAFRKSCHNTEIIAFVIDDKLKKIVRLTFKRKNGVSKNSIFIPKGFAITQVDDKGNIIESIYNEKTKWRDKVRYKFNTDKFIFEEIESYSQQN